MPARSRSAAVPLVAALALATLATTLVSVAPIFAGAVREAGVRAALAESEPDAGGVRASFRLPGAEWATVPNRLARLAPAVVPTTSTDVLIGTTDAYRLIDRADLPDRWISGFAAVSDGMLRPASRVVPAATGTLGARLHTDAADALGVVPGDRVRLERPSGVVEVTVVGLVEPVDRTDRRWWREPLVRDGVAANGSFTEIGPFLVDGVDLASLPGSVNVTWRLFPVADAASADDLDMIRRGAGSLRTRIEDEFGPVGLSVETGLVSTVASLGTTVTTSGAVIGSVLLQLVAIALAGVGLAASVLASRRAEEFDVLRSRGTGIGQHVVLAVGEGLLVGSIAGGLGPLLALPVVGALERWGPLATSGLDLRPSSSAVAWILASAVGFLVVVVVAWPSIRPDRRPGAHRSGRERRSGAAGVGVELAVVTVAALALWRLSVSEFSSADHAGRLGADPVLLLAPAVGVVAVALVALRSIRIVAVFAERSVAQSGSSVRMLAWRELAREPATAGRVGTLAALAVCITVMAAAQSATWGRSVIDQADAAVTVDAFVVRSETPEATAAAPYLAPALERMRGVGAVFPVDRTSAAIAAGDRVPVVLTDTRSLAREVRLGEELLSTGDRQLMAELHRPADLGGVVLDDGVTANGHEHPVVLSYRLDGRNLPDTGAVRVRITLVDGDGSVVVTEVDQPSTGEDGIVGVSTTFDVLGGEVVGLRPPLRLVSFDVSFPSVQDRRDPAERETDPVETASYDLTVGPVRVGERSVPLVADWRIGDVSLDGAIDPPSFGVSPTKEGFRLSVDSGSTPNAAASLSLSVDSGPIGDGEGEGIPVLASESYLRRSAIAVGDRIAARIDGVSTELEVVGSIPVVPFAVGEEVALIADRETALADRLDRARRSGVPTGWAMSVVDTAVDDVSVALADPAAGIERLDDRRAEARRIARDPVLIGLAAGWGLAAVAAPAIAALGLAVVAAATLRERRGWSAVLRALGMRSIEVVRWRLTVVVPVVLGSCIIGAAGGSAIAGWTMGAAIRTADGSAPIPPATLVVPWATIGASIGVLVAVAAASAVFAGRRLGSDRPGADVRGEAP